MELVLHQESLPYAHKVICKELISRHHDNLLAGYVGIDKNCKLVTQKYYWPAWQYNVKVNIKDYNIQIASKVVRPKYYANLQSLPMPMHCSKEMSMDFVIGLSVSTNQNRKIFNSILVIVDRVTKMVHYKLVKVRIYDSELAEVIINMVIRHHRLLDSIASN